MGATADPFAWAIGRCGDVLWQWSMIGRDPLDVKCLPVPAEGAKRRGFYVVTTGEKFAKRPALAAIVGGAEAIVVVEEQDRAIGEVIRDEAQDRHRRGIEIAIDENEGGGTECRAAFQPGEVIPREKTLIQ